MKKTHNNPGDMPFEIGVRHILLAFILSCLYGVVAGLPFFVLKDAIPMLLLKVFPPVPTSWPQNIYIIITVCVLGIAWLVSVYVLWNRIEKMSDMIARLRTVGIWCLCAIVLWIFGLLIRWVAVAI